MNEYGADNAVEDFFLCRVALTLDDAVGLPSFDTAEKVKDPRYNWFVQKYGNQAWELDAMDPNQLREKVTRAIWEYIDPGDWEKHQKLEEEQRETTKKIAEAMAKAGAK